MVYSEEFMKFWNFHGKALRFMSGAKSAGRIIDGSTSKGLYHPQRTSINFAVPNVSSVNNFDALETNIPKPISPSIITQTLNLLPRDKTYVLSFHFKYFFDKSIGLDNRLCLYKSSPTTRCNN